MAKRNAKLSAYDREAIIKQTAVDNPDVPETAEGAGSLNSQAAIDIASGPYYFAGNKNKQARTGLAADDGFQALTDEEEERVINAYSDDNRSSSALRTTVINKDHCKKHLNFKFRDSLIAHRKKKRNDGRRIS